MTNIELMNKYINKTYIELKPYNGLILGKSFSLTQGEFNPEKELIKRDQESYFVIIDGRVEMVVTSNSYEQLWVELLYQNEFSQLEDLAAKSNALSIKGFKAAMTRAARNSDLEYARELLVQPIIYKEWNGIMAKIFPAVIKFGQTPEHYKSHIQWVTIDSTIAMCYSDAQKFIKKNRKTLLKMLIGELKISDKFRRYGIPLGFFKIDSAILTRDCRLVITLSLKE